MSEHQDLSDKELLDAIKNVLKKNGYLNKLQAEMRAKVTEVLQERQMSSSSTVKNPNPPEPCGEVMLVSELVREYLQWSGLLHSAALLTSEAGMPPPSSRAQLCAALGVKDDDKSASLPLLPSIVAAYTERIQRKINRTKRDNQ